MHRRPPLILPLVLLAGLVAGCSSSVKVEPFEQSDSQVCGVVADSWPPAVAGQPQRADVAVQSQGVAAWGDPPIIARCGAPMPEPTTDQCLDVDGVDWVALPLEDGVRFTTYGRDPAIQVLVPDAYAPEPLVLPAFGPAAETIEQLRHCS